MMRFAGVLLTATMIFTAACGDDEPTGPDGTPTGSSITARVDGEDWSATGVTGVRSSGAVSIAGSATDGTSISFAWVDEGPGSYAIPTSLGLNFTYSGPTSLGSWVAAASSGGGTVNVTSISDDRVVGTFQFTAQPVPNTNATGDKVVTNGTFDVEF